MGAKKKRIIRNLSRYKESVASRKQKQAEFERQLSSRYSEARCPVYEAAHTSTLFEKGIGHVLLSRRVDNAKIAFSVFLVDVYCLGAKNAFFKEESNTKYEEIKQHLFRNDPIKRISSYCARKLVEESVAYAGKIGFSPHKDYTKAKRIFGDIDTEECKSEFAFGKDGKPFYISGPNETKEEANEIVSILESNCGSGNYHYIVHIDPPTI